MQVPIVGRDVAASKMRRAVDGGVLIASIEEKLDVKTAVSAPSFVLKARETGDGEATRSSITPALMDTWCSTE